MSKIGGFSKSEISRRKREKRLAKALKKKARKSALPAAVVVRGMFEGGGKP
jgi:hypothetical protein